LPDDQFCADKLRQYASRFSIQRFKDKIEKLVRENLPERMEHGHKDSFQGTGSR
jgi:hypothetical protein